MYIINDKLYIVHGSKLVGIDFSVSTGYTMIKGTELSKCDETMLSKKYTMDEIIAKFNITDETPYKFPIPKIIIKEAVKEELKDNGVIKNEQTVNVKKSTGKRGRK